MKFWDNLGSMKKIIQFGLVALLLMSFSTASLADPGDYYLRALAGPSFNLSDWNNQFRIGGEFYYDVGYNMNLSMLTLFGISDLFRFQLIPGFSYNYLYLGPAIFHVLGGMGYGRMHSDNTFDLRFATGLRLPLGNNLEAYTDVNYFASVAGTTGTPQTFDWLMGLGFRF